MVSVDRLFQLVVQARAVGRLQDYLAVLRDKRGLSQRELPVTGTAEKTAEVVSAAVEEGLLSIEDLADFVDEVEDTGGQHIFLFDLAEGYEDYLSEDRLAGLFDGRPESRSEHFYAPYPNDRWFWYRKDQKLIVKQVCTAEFWEREVVESTPEKRVVVFEKKKRRATNSLWLRSNPGVDVRIDRVTSAMNDELASSILLRFLDGFEGDLDLRTHLVPVRVWRGFRDMIHAKQETYMTVDEAQDPSVRQRISNRRAQGIDVRDHESYDLDLAKYFRSSLNIYWKMPWDPAQKVHTILSRVEIGGLAYGKVFINAKVTPRELDHVVSRVRHFAS